jgi:hypothetical protein
MDLGIKVEMILFEMYSNLFWNSVSELVIFGVLLILFMSDGGQFTGIWLLLLHVIRGVIGLVILRNLPLTHNIIKTASIPHDEKMDYDKMFEYVTFAAKEALDHFTTKTKALLKTYFGLTILCMAIDLMFFISNVRFYSDKKRVVYSNITYLI